MKSRKIGLNPLWGEEESKNFGKVAIEYAAGEDVVLDQAFVQSECLVNEAHVVMLSKRNIIDQKIAKKLLLGLEEIRKLDKKGKFILKKELEDVHSNVEQFLIERDGIEVGGYLRLGIARNDQVYTDTRMFMREKILSLSAGILKLIAGITGLARQHTKTVMPGYTHLRISQPITYGHWLTAKAYHFFDDLCNVLSLFEIVNLSPLGIFEMAGTHLPIDRKLTAKLLGFDGVTPNSLYTANQRGELEAQFIASLSGLALHVRRTMSEIIIFSSHEFGLVKIDDLYTTGGTAQPNLKNPDTLEVVRANIAKLLALFVETILMMDSLPSGFNRDTQQTKPALFTACKVMSSALPVVAGILTTLKPNRERMETVAGLNFATAPDVSVQLAVKGKVSFREAYKVVKTLISQKYLKQSFVELTPEMVESVSQKVLGKRIVVSQKDLAAVADAQACVFAHASEGGPAPKAVKKQLADLTKKTKKIKEAIAKKESRINAAYKLLAKEVYDIIYPSYSGLQPGTGEKTD